VTAITETENFLGNGRRPGRPPDDVLRACKRCGHSFDAVLTDYRCPRCGCVDTEVVGGELRPVERLWKRILSTPAGVFSIIAIVALVQYLILLVVLAGTE